MEPSVPDKLTVQGIFRCIPAAGVDLDSPMGIIGSEIRRNAFGERHFDTPVDVAVYISVGFTPSESGGEGCYALGREGLATDPPTHRRSEARRVGTECVGTCKAGREPYYKKKKKKKTLNNR